MDIVVMMMMMMVVVVQVIVCFCWSWITPTLIAQTATDRQIQTDTDRQIQTDRQTDTDRQWVSGLLIKLSQSFISLSSHHCCLYTDSLEWQYIYLHSVTLVHVDSREYTHGICITTVLAAWLRAVVVSQDMHRVPKKPSPQNFGWQ